MAVEAIERIDLLTLGDYEAVPEKHLRLVAPLEEPEVRKLGSVGMMPRPRIDEEVRKFEQEKFHLMSGVELHDV